MTSSQLVGRVMEHAEDNTMGVECQSPLCPA
jgi:hypothetical protein